MKAFFTYSDPIVPPHHPRVLIETAQAQGAARAALLENTGLTEAMLVSPDARISYAQFAVLTSNAIRLTNNTGLGFDAGANVRLPNLGILGLAIMSSPTVGAALDVALRHYRAIAPLFDLETRVEGDVAYFTVREAIPLAPFAAFSTEFLLSAFDRQGRSFLGRALPILKVRLGYAEPDHLARYADLYANVPLAFDQNLTEVSFDAALLAAPNAEADPLTAKVAEQYCVQEAPATLPSTGLLAQVRRQLSAAAGRPPSLTELSRSLRTSSRSLRRFLQSMGTSYQTLIDESRRARAEEWVRSTHMTIEQVSGRLGFSDVRSFRRAFKRWTGVTPHAFRGGPGDG
jgi:AraC-like DNA-binding protein